MVRVEHDVVDQSLVHVQDLIKAWCMFRTSYPCSLVRVEHDVVDQSLVHVQD